MQWSARKYNPNARGCRDNVITANLFSIYSHVSIRDENQGLQMTVLNDRTQGGSSVMNGELKLMVHQRLESKGQGGDFKIDKPGVDGKGLKVKVRKCETDNIRSRKTIDIPEVKGLVNKLIGNFIKKIKYTPSGDSSQNNGSNSGNSVAPVLNTTTQTTNTQTTTDNTTETTIELKKADEKQKFSEMTSEEKFDHMFDEILELKYSKQNNISAVQTKRTPYRPNKWNNNRNGNSQTYGQQNMVRKRNTGGGGAFGEERQRSDQRDPRSHRPIRNQNGNNWSENRNRNHHQNSYHRTPHQNYGFDVQRNQNNRYVNNNDLMNEMLNQREITNQLLQNMNRNDSSNRFLVQTQRPFPQN
ncbi:unnamed protein product [Medioppia subpectinata]|uniref:Uncharacterized protein n=1 Tax=Medioppia subpectinata TaxID=1979941 RepID=A0A7R9PVU0_9ACAR|nr:unnamed protein product [Medioppia subpectinata]CAG2102159.1 unnamed protein product [Medioppia subpectinata]